MSSVAIGHSEKQDIQKFFENLQHAHTKETQAFAISFAQGNEASWRRFIKGAYNHPITWWVGIFQLQMQMGVWGHNHRSAASVRANKLWQISKPLRDEAYGGIQGENTPMLSAIVRFNLEHRKADIMGRLTGGQFTNYAIRGGRLGSKQLSISSKAGVAMTNAGIAGYGAAIKALVEGHTTLDSIVQAILTGKPETLPDTYLFDRTTPLTSEESAIVQTAGAILHEVIKLTRAAPNSTSIKDFCSRPGNLNLKGLCK